MDCVSIQRGQDVITGAHPKNFIGGFLEGAARGIKQIFGR
jgi:hypothetical protein